MTKLKVNVIIAGRTYPLSVNDVHEEEGMRRAAKEINELILKFERNYAVADKQDVLAMCALQFASRAEISALKNAQETTKALQKINDLSQILDNHLK